jgi:hypothetical protein
MRANFLALALRSSVHPELATDAADVSPRDQAVRTGSGTHPRSFRASRPSVRQAPKTLAAEQALNRLAAEIALDIAARLKGWRCLYTGSSKDLCRRG